MDHAPGPSIAKAAPRVPNRRGIDRSPGREIAIHNSMIATSTPVMGVHRPIIRSVPVPTVIHSRVAGPSGYAPDDPIKP